MTSTHLPSARQDGREAVHAVVLALACAVTYWLSTSLLDLIPSLGHTNNLLGGMWAVIATVFVYRDVRTEDVTNALSRMSATLVSFVLCEAYLLLFPFNALGMGVLIGAGALILTALGRPGDAVTAGITTTVVMVVAHLSAQHAWQQPILRVFDTVVGTAVALAAGWLSTRLLRQRARQHAPG